MMQKCDLSRACGSWKTGVRPPRSKDQGKSCADYEADEEFEQFPAPFLSRKSLDFVCEVISEFISFTVRYVFLAALKFNNPFLWSAIGVRTLQPNDY